MKDYLLKSHPKGPAVLAQLMLARPASRHQIARETSISPATVTRTIEGLIRQGLVYEVSELVQDQRGRRPVLLDIRAEDAIVAGVDLGASNTRMLTADLIGRVRTQAEMPTPDDLNPTSLGVWLAEQIFTTAGVGWPNIQAVHIGLPGAVAREKGTISNAPNLPQIEDPEFLKVLTTKLAKPIVVDNDANYALLGEQHFGAARKAQTAVMITLGTGLGSSIAVDGRILRGKHGLVGEFGQIPAGPEGAPLEQMVTGRGILASAARSGHSVTSPADIFSPHAPIELAPILARFENALLILLAAATASCEPDLIVLSGGIAKSLVSRLRQYEDALRKIFGSAPTIVYSTLGDLAGATGAAVSALHSIYRRLDIDERALAFIPTPTSTQNP